MCRFLVYNSPHSVLYIYNPSLFLVPNSFDLSYWLFAFLGLLMEYKLIAISIPKDDVMISSEVVHVALKLVVVPPHNLIDKVLLPEHLIQNRFRIMSNVLIKMYVKATRLVK